MFVCCIFIYLSRHVSYDTLKLFTDIKCNGQFKPNFKTSDYTPRELESFMD